MIPRDRLDPGAPGRSHNEKAAPSVGPWRRRFIAWVADTVRAMPSSSFCVFAFPSFCVSRLLPILFLGRMVNPDEQGRHGRSAQADSAAGSKSGPRSA